MDAAATTPVPEVGIFRTTRWSLVLAAAQPEGSGFREALEQLGRQYRPAICAFLRAYCRCNEDEAEDLAQAFLTQWAAGGMHGADEKRGRFRTYLRGALRHFVQKHRRAQNAVKRGGGTPLAADRHQSTTLADIPDARTVTPEEAFDAAYRCDLLAKAVEALEREYAQEDRPEYMVLFRKYYLDPPADSRPPTHQALSDEYGFPVTDVNNWLAHARSRLRRIVVSLVRESVTDEQGFRQEMEMLCRERGSSS